VTIRREHRGIPFDEWLDIFLEYALDLAFTDQIDEAYTICMSAKDSVVYKSKENAFLIQITHASMLYPCHQLLMLSLADMRTDSVCYLSWR
jgi:hypothetical protein